jgi:ceramide glucosyltransferase
LKTILGCLAVLSLGLMLWQWCVAWRFPLHRRVNSSSFLPAVTLLKPLKGCDETTEDCLRSWLAQDYPGHLQVLFGVAQGDDPVCPLVRRLLREFPDADAQLVVCGPPRGANLKVSKLVELELLARHELLIISDADVKAPPDLVANVIAPLRQAEVGLVTAFYRLANPTTLAMRWEALATNADFWSQVLQALSLKPLGFALGAVMATRRRQLRDIGGLQALANCLADDYELGRRIARRGYRLELSPLVVECWSAPMGWEAVWKHQLRWARTIRLCQPFPYFLSILSNPTLWPLCCLAANPGGPALLFGLGCWFTRMAMALDLQARLERGPEDGGRRSEVGGRRTEDGGRRSEAAVRSPQSAVHNPGPGGWSRARGGWLALLKDLLQPAIWLLAFTGNTIEWRGQKMRLRRDGTMAPAKR